MVRNIREFIQPHKIGILNNAIATPDMTDIRRGDVFRKYGIKEESRLVVSLGRFTRQKAFDQLIEAFRRVVSEAPNAVLFIGGDGEEKSRIDSMVRSGGLQESIRLPGVVSDIHEVLALCDLYVNSSRWEGLPMTLLEAMAHGKPMVATSVGGNPEVVRDGVTGLLVPPDDPEKLAGAITKMLTDNDFRIKTGRAADSLFKQGYTIDKHCARLSDYYLQVTK